MFILSINGGVEMVSKQCHWFNAIRGLTIPKGSETLEELKEKLILRGQKFESMCNAKTEDRFRRYGGPVMKEGEIEMLGEGGGDVRNYTMRFILFTDPGFSL
jgi:hypothetical protein